MSFLQHTAGGGYEITPDDNVDLPQTANAIYIGGDGDIVLVSPDGSTLTFTGLLAGNILPWKAKRILATGTTATGLIAATTK